MSEAPPSSPPPARPDWTRRLLIAAVVLVTVLVVSIIAAALVPRAWAQAVGAQSDGSILVGSAVGLFYGFVFTFLPLAVLWWTFRRRRGRRVWAIGAAVALLVALPNLMTLSIVIGTGSASHAGERTLDVEAPGFRGGTLLGAALAVAVFAFWRYQGLARWRTGREADRLRGELEAERAARGPGEAARDGAEQRSPERPA